MYTVEEISDKRMLAAQLNLSGWELLDDIGAVQRDCNGIGAEWMGANVRGTVSAINPTLTLAADIHDRRYAIGGTEADRKAADDEFLANSLILARYRYRWYDPRRYIVISQARKFYRLLQLFGDIAFNYTYQEMDK